MGAYYQNQIAVFFLKLILSDFDFLMLKNSVVSTVYIVHCK